MCVTRHAAQRELFRVSKRLGARSKRTRVKGTRVSSTLRAMLGVRTLNEISILWGEGGKGYFCHS